MPVRDSDIPQSNVSDVLVIGSFAVVMTNDGEFVSVGTVQILARLEAAIRSIRNLALAQRLQCVGRFYDRLHFCPREFDALRNVAPSVTVQEFFRKELKTRN